MVTATREQSGRCSERTRLAVFDATRKSSTNSWVEFMAMWIGVTAAAGAGAGRAAAAVSVHRHSSMAMATKADARNLPTRAGTPTRHSRNF